MRRFGQPGLLRVSHCARSLNAHRIKKPGPAHALRPRQLSMQKHLSRVKNLSLFRSAGPEGFWLNVLGWELLSTTLPTPARMWLRNCCDDRAGERVYSAVQLPYSPNLGSAAAGHAGAAPTPCSIAAIEGIGAAAELRCWSSACVRPLRLAKEIRCGYRSCSQSCNH